ncbi:filamentous hemagglutinin family protein [Methylomonas sp. SURF-2]|uniref:Filamentous hemagglutinin family protein n=1 Tax=Methylomonas subterranea TaxID=2952225 RepID=A0ABT1TDL7_9GAMM|nr:filamentous haemagglutinin family protein [Methylomonas sp. SURF-2]MCQ8103515.1 filamentous hemagglutinin family protein [Methylomonas sp. SURF-2]
MAYRQQNKHSKPTDFRLNTLAACIKTAVTGGMLMSFATPVCAELPVPSAVWASMGGAIASVNPAGTAMHIEQQTDRVILNWDKFNVSAGNSVNFQQPSSSSIALNKIHQADPSQILGTVSANGQLYLVNNNGFVFGKDSRVNARGLVASTLDISEETLRAGISKRSGIDQQAALEGNGDFYQRDGNGNFKLDADGNKIPVKILTEAGAKISSTEGGRILIIAPSIENRGDVSSAGGQVVMAAATDKVYLQEAPLPSEDPNADPVANSDVRGLLVEVKTGGKVENLGNISADRGNVTLVGFAVNQNGRVSATTATNVNGTIRLLARENGTAQLIAGKTQLIPGSTTRVADNGDGLGTSARVSFGENSKTEILPEVEYGVETRTVQGSAPVEVVVEKTAIDAQPQPQSRIEAVGHKVHVKSGANITAPGGKVELTATRAPANPVADNSAVNDSRVLIDSGARIDVSGIDTVTRSMESNVIEVELRNFELKDAPLQKDGVLKNEKVSIDIRQGSPLTDIGPTVAGIKRTIAERLTEGGDIVLRSEGDVIVEKGAVLDVSGGFITYLDGYINTSKLISNGRLIDIGVADPLRRYDGIYGQYTDSSEKWGAAATRTWYASGPFSLGRFERGYVEGKNAGSLTIRANQVVLEGQLLAKAVNGRYQREIADQARGGILNINTRFNDNNVQSVEFTTTPAQPLNLGIDDVLPGGYGNVLAFQAGSLLSGGFSDVSINSNGKITVNRNVDLRLADGGSVTAANGSVEHVGGSLRLVGGQIDIQGRISGAGARVDLNTVLVTPAANVNGDIVIGPAAVVDLQGNWVNDFVTPANLDGKSIAIEGGKFSATMAGASGGSLLLQKGSVIDVSGGAQVRADRTLRAGKAGSVTLVAKPEVENVGANIELRGLINGYGIGQGGRFVLVANSVRVRREEELDNSPGIKPLQLTADFFGRGGFADYEIGANLNGLSVESGAVINLSQSNRILNNSFLQQANAAGIAGFSRVGRLAEQFRAAGSLKLSSDHSAGSNPAANLTLAQGAAIVADPLSKIELVSDSGLIVDGRIQTAGGSVQLSIIPDQSNLDPQYQATQGIWLGANARINVAGSARVMTDALGRRYGEVFDGGSVVIDAQRGFFASQAGSLINVSGTQALLDVPVINAGGVGATYRATQIGSNAGNIDITTAEGAFMAGGMLARAGAAPGAAGGSLTLILNSDNRSDPEPLSSSFPAAARTILITQQQQTVLSGGFARPGDALPQAENGKAYLSVAQIDAGGFASLALATQGVNGDNNVLYDNGEIRFVGDIQLNLANRIALDSVKLGWQRQNAGDSGLVSLNAASVALGSDLQRQPSWQPSAGDGHLKVNAKLIDLIGGMTTLGFNRVDLTAANDIRLKGIRVDSNELDFVGQFKTYSQLNLTAAQVYPTSLTDFTLAVAGDPDGSVTIAHSGAKAGQVYSAMGKLTISAPNIQQNGTLLAPLGEINLQAGKNIGFGGQSLTSVSAAGKIIPLGVTQGGLEWMLPLAGTGGNMNVVNPDIKPADFDKKFIFESPRKKITVSADKIQREEGALVDLSGGGDLLAYEFIPGDGGTLDVLDSNGVFAILPGFNGYAPYDPSTFPASGLQIGERIYLSAGSGVAAGFYTLLPARYALLRGAFLVTPLASNNVVEGSSRSRVDGAAIVSGYRGFSDTGYRDQRWSEFVVEAGGIAKTRSEYNLSYASQFFAKQAESRELAIPRQVQDAGQLVLNAKTALELVNVMAEVGAGGRGGLVDVVAEKLAIGSTADTGDIELSAADIDKFNVNSLLLGAVRSFDPLTGHISLDVRAKTVTVAENTEIVIPELMLAATDRVELLAGSRIDTSAGSGRDQTVSTLEVTGDGALLRVSAGAQANVLRSGNAGAKGDLLMRAGATISAGSGSVLMESSRTTKMDGELALAGGALKLVAESINLGETDDSLSGLSLDNAILSGLTAKQTVLSSRGMVNIYGELPQTGGDGLAFGFGDLVIDAHGLAGKNNAGDQVVLNADHFTLTNTHANTAPAHGDGSGSLLINANQVVLADGKYSLSGFSDIRFNVAERVLGSGNAVLTSLANLTVDTPVMTAENGAATSILLPGRTLAFGPGLTEAAAQGQGIAGQLWLEADSIDLNTTLIYRSGRVSLNALTGDIALGEQALVDVGGSVVAAGLSGLVAVNAGSIAFNAWQGDIATHADSRLLLNAGHAKAQAGELALRAIQGVADLHGIIEAQGAEKALGGSLSVDSQTLAAGGFGAWIDRFAQAGFSGGIDFRLRSGDLTVGADESIEAGRIQLAADSGAVNVAGTLDARGGQGGSIGLAAEDAIGVLDGAKLLAGAIAENGAGGKVWLSSIDDRQNPDGAGIVIQSAAGIDVSANGDGKAGEVVLRAERVGNDIAVADIADGVIVGTDAVQLEAVRIYDYSVLNQTALDTIQSHTQQYMDAAYPLVSARFGNGYQLLPGVEVRSSGDLTLSAQWDLSGWRYGPDALPGVLTLRAGGDLMLNQSLSDGFVQGFIDTVDFGPIGISDMLQSGRSWSFNLIAGADIGAADNLALQMPAAISAPAAKGDLKLAAGVKLRTGTGDIVARAARDIVLANANSVIYTAGRPDDANRWGSGGETFGVFFYAEYPLEGGDIDLRAGRNFEAKPAQQLLSEALVRTGNWSRNTDHTGERPTAWGVALGVNEANPDFVANHQQSVASFGGGNVNIKVGGNVNDLSVSVSSSGKQVGAKADPNNPGSLDFISNELLINNGGSLQLTAGGDINGGVFYVDGNSASLTAGGSFKAGDNTLPGQHNLKPIVALGDTDFSVTAGRSLALEALVDPFFATLPTKTSDVEGISNRFFRYGADSSVSLLALSGDISLENDSARLNAGANTQLLGDANSLAYPASLHIAALYGDLSFNKGLTLVPSALGALTMYAGGQLTGNADIHLSDADPVLLPTAVLPSSTSDELLRITNLLNPKIGGSDSHAARPLHTDDPNPVLISTGTGNIGSRDLNLAFYLNKPTEVSAGKDIVKTLFSIQHNRDGAVSVIQANRDINFPVTFNRLNGIIDEVNQGLEVAGPGQLTVLAGRDVNLGASLGVVSTGNQGNPALAEEGANISVIAGLAKGGIDAPGFAAGFVYGNPLFADMAQRVGADADLARRFRAEMQALTGQQLDTQQALAAFESLSQARRDAISSSLGLEGVTGGEQCFRQQLLTEMRTITGDQSLTFDGATAAYAGLSDAQKLRVSGKLVGAAQPMYTYIIKRAAIDLARAGVKQDQDANELKLLAAVEALFPKTTVLNGNSQYSTDPLRGVITLGGASAGSILDAGYRNAGSRPSEGDIAMFLSTIQTRDGGEVAVFAPAGGILVGLATSNIGLQKGDDQLGIIVNKQGNANLIARDDIDVNVSRVVTLGGGSILGGSTENDFDAGRAPQTALAAPPLKVSYDAIGQVVLEVAPLLAGGGARATGRGDITLFAPRGIIDAGEAGIAGNNVILAATAIMGANNISFGQSATGVPAAPTGGIAAGLAGVGNVAAAVSKAVESSTDMSKDAANSLAKAAGGMGILSVEVIGFGDDG